MTETLYDLPAAGAVQDGLDPLGDLLPRPLRCGLVAGLPVLADADMQVGRLTVIDGGPASGALGFIHAPIIGVNKCVDKYSGEVFNVNTLNQEADMIRNDGKRICDKEIGHYTRGWHSCKRGAVVSVMSTKSAGMTLDYCAKHQPKSTNVGQ